jgi:hypothetical protein
MSNRAKRPPKYQTIFPTKTPRSIFELHDELMMSINHTIHFEDHGWGHIAVVCTCGFDVSTPWGEQMAERIKENHYAYYKIIPDPLGAKYRA